MECQISECQLSQTSVNETRTNTTHAFNDNYFSHVFLLQKQLPFDFRVEEMALEEKFFDRTKLEISKQLSRKEY